MSRSNAADELPKLMKTLQLDPQAIMRNARHGAGLRSMRAKSGAVMMKRKGRDEILHIAIVYQTLRSLYALTAQDDRCQWDDEPEYCACDQDQPEIAISATFLRLNR